MIVVISDETVEEFREARTRAHGAEDRGDDSGLIDALMDALDTASEVFDAPEHR